MVLTSAILTAILLAGPTSNDEKAILALWNQVNRGYETANLKLVWSTFSPKYYALMNQTITPPNYVYGALKQRFELQVDCHRRFKVNSLKVAGSQAFLEVEGIDSYHYRREGKVVAGVQRRKERSEWQKTPEGWRQDHVRIVKYDWKQPDGTWKDMLPRP